VIEHNKNFYSLEELKRTRDSLEGYLDNEEVYYFVGVIRYACDEIERLNNIINELEKDIEKEKKNY
jgi:chaperonin cofactor prefoldin